MDGSDIRKREPEAPRGFLDWRREAWRLAWIALAVFGTAAGLARASEGGHLSPELIAQAQEAKGSIILALFGLIAISAAASGAETAIFSLNKLDVLQIRGRRTAGTRALRYLLDRPSDTLTTLLVVNNFVNVGVSLAAGTLTQIFFAGHGPEAFALAAVGATTFILVFGEVVPKCMAHALAHTVARWASWPVAALAILMTPIRIGINAIIQGAFRSLGVEERPATDWVSEEELKAVISAGEVSNVLEEDEREMIEGVFELRHSFAEEIMIPRTDVEAYPETIDQEEMIERLRGTRHSRVIVYKESLDHPLGFVLAKEALLDPTRAWRDLLREAPVLPARVKLIDLLKRFRRDRSKLAVLVDEYGGVAGIVTQHDLLEEIVGDIAERHETASPEIQSMGPGRWRVSGQMNLHELGKELEREFPDDLGTTIGGFVMNMLGRVPSPGEELRHDGLLMRVTRMAGRRVAQIEIEVAAEDEGAQEEPR